MPSARSVENNSGGANKGHALASPLASVVTKAVDAETETKTEAARFETEAKTETVASETEAKTETVYLKTESEAQGSWPILLTVMSSGAVLAQKF